MVTKSARGAHDRRVSLAPPWHTAVLVALQLAVALTGTLLQHAGAPSAAPSARGSAAADRIFAEYLPLLIVNWTLVLYCARLFRGSNALSDLLGHRARNARQLALDLACAVGCFFVILGLELAASHLLAAGRNAAIAALLPRTAAERLTWVVVAISVGFCEEVVFRGYLRIQLAAFSHSRALGVVLQAVLFGLAHLEQGPVVALRTGVYGVVLGVLAEVRGSLVPGIVCHVGLDLLGAFRH